MSHAVLKHQQLHERGRSGTQHVPPTQIKTNLRHPVKEPLQQVRQGEAGSLFNPDAYLIRCVRDSFQGHTGPEVM